MMMGVCCVCGVCDVCGACRAHAAHVSDFSVEDRFYSFCKVGSGYSDNELRLLQKMLEKHWKPFNAQSPPACFQLQGVQEKPDVWLDPRQCVPTIIRSPLVTSV